MASVSSGQWLVDCVAATSVQRGSAWALLRCEYLEEMAAQMAREHPKLCGPAAEQEKDASSPS